MEDLISEIAISVISVIGIPVAIYGIRYLHSLIKNTDFARRTQIDEFIFKTLEDQVITHMSRIIKAKKDKKAHKGLQTKARHATLSYLQTAAIEKGVDAVKIYGTSMLEKMLHTTVKKVKAKII